MPSKYDTNPLDPDFPEKARAEAEAQAATQVLWTTGAETRQFAPTAATEEQTRRFASPDMAAYQAPCNGQFVPGNYEGTTFAAADQSISRKVDKVGLPENVMTSLPYFPLYIGLVAGLLMLLFVPKSEAKVRFHAAQGLAAHIGILIVTSILSIIGNVTGVARAGNVIFQVAMTVMLIIWAIKAWKGKPVHIESVDSLTNWLEEKISVKT